MRNPNLHDLLQSFRFEETGAPLTFARRLARENRWTPAYAERVVTEYLRFVYLAMVADAPVTPSAAVDQAWHLHLVYTRSYWEDLCRDVLPRPLHHGPTRGGRREAEKFHDWYERTLGLYAEEFGSPPATDIWPSASVRFASAAQPVSVTPHEFWVIEKRVVRRLVATVGIAAAAIPVWLGARNEGSGSDTVLILIGVGILVGIVLFACRRGGGKGNGCGSGCSGSAGSSHHHGHSGCGGDSGCGSSGCGGGCGGGD